MAAINHFTLNIANLIIESTHGTRLWRSTPGLVSIAAFPHPPCWSSSRCSLLENQGTEDQCPRGCSGEQSQRLKTTFHSFIFFEWIHSNSCKKLEKQFQASNNFFPIDHGKAVGQGSVGVGGEGVTGGL